MKKFPKPGDILILDRKIYKHYGVYVGNNTVIHYAAEGSDFSGDIAIRETTLDAFASDCDFIIGQFTKTYIAHHAIFSAEETIARAFSRLGEQKYNLLTNNCEHFALWCKTGFSHSTQVKNFWEGVQKFVEQLDIPIVSDIVETLPTVIDFVHTFTLQNDFQNLELVPTKTISTLTFDEVKTYFLQNHIVQKQKSDANIKALAVRQKNKIILCLFDQKQNTTYFEKIYKTHHIDAQLQNAFGNKNLLVVHTE